MLKHLRLVLYGGAALLLLVAVAASLGGSRPRPAPAALTMATMAPVATTPPRTATPEEMVKLDAARVCGARLVSVAFDVVETVVECRLGDAFSERDIAELAVLNMLELTRAALQHGTDSINLRLMAGFKNDYGATSQQLAYGFRIQRPLYAKIDWANIYNRDLAKLLARHEDGSDLVIHPAMRAGWQAFVTGK